MADEIMREAAWQHRCARLRELGLDRYNPDVRHPEVEKIEYEYRVAVGDIIPVPEDWEGDPPERRLSNLPDLANWLILRERCVLRTEMGDCWNSIALAEAARAIRNGYRVLTSLGVEEDLECKPPPKTLKQAKEQLGDLIDWVVNKKGWKPKPQVPENPALERAALAPPPVVLNGQDKPSAAAEQGWTTVADTPPPSPASKTGCEGRAPMHSVVVLDGPSGRPVINGKTKKPLTMSRYRVVQALLDAGPEGLTKDELSDKAGVPDGRKTLKGLADSDGDWRSVIHFPGTRGIGYRIG